MDQKSGFGIAKNERILPNIEIAQGHDLAAIAQLTARRNGDDSTKYLPRIQAQYVAAPTSCQLFVARLTTKVVGFARVSWLTISTIPEGWYLSGVIVDPMYRRRGIAAALTRYRMEWLASETGTIYYFANSCNRASIDLHAAFGFREIAREIDLHDCTFEGGVGVLFELNL